MNKEIAIKLNMNIDDQSIIDQVFDVLIIGGGPMGLAVGIEAQKNDLTHLIIEKGALINSIYHFPKNMNFFSTSMKLELGEVPFTSINDKPTRDEALEYYRRVALKWELKIKFYEMVLDVNRTDDGNFEVISDKRTYKAKNVVVATGFYDQPNKLNIPGEELSKVFHYYDAPHPYIDQKVVIVGAGNSAAQVALELWHKGVDVTMIIRENAVSENVKYWIRPNIVNRIKDGSIKANFNSTLKKIDFDSVTFEQDGEDITIDNDFVLAMTGYRPDYDFLKRIGVESINSTLTPVYDQHTHETNAKSIYMSGVICGGMITNTYSIENSKDHAVKIINSIRGKNG